jgi:hypothetical protein
VQNDSRRLENGECGEFEYAIPFYADNDPLKVHTEGEMTGETET